MRGIIIAGGLGTRLRPLTLTRPKPLIPLVNLPLLEHQLWYLREAGIFEVCFATNFMADAVHAKLGEGSRHGMNLKYAVEREPLDTGGAIRNAYDSFSGDDCVVLNGDTIHSFDIASIAKTHYDRGAIATLTLRQAPRPHPYGVVTVAAEGKIAAFDEPSDDEKRGVNDSPSVGTDWINAGVYVLTREVLESIPQRKCNIEREIFPRLISESGMVFADCQSGFWMDVGNPSQYRAASAAIVGGQVRSPKEAVKVSPSAKVSADCKIDAISVIGDEATVGDGCNITESIVLERVRIGTNCKISCSIIGEDAVVEPGVELMNNIIPPREKVSPNSALQLIGTN